ncbi:Predicted signal transduction protein containing EFhand domain [Trichormus variabilis ATCC 29413]|uniref:Predicted signal transduction protein containing EFhand domain n=2 Tax=Anabaena variabilis TaxID=264691 RepID=Q3M403_TRIV2|nr:MULTISPECIES: EF-hand domain-containing protein [Nostocaceae]ABA24283.1 Predicted signal transduction protein containing EFhand domain [Trichormus variabilis ATCC 29413]MBC1216356.1 EF-hand domain-containing protein [Trichormus variabilis ARAD]MBC1257482.1 EF-hand domain-containing protein [Trichormus variabilis V5]MBC1269656.1 EF-hand domain-containing protein [Trichormus variabilis FSR]MBC1301886.1 EF-hand domain-containing protein [Trichormus variabilis N2B]
MTTEQELQSLFNTLDRDQDGKISINELFLSPGLSAVISSETNTNSPQELLVQYDSDQDGSITFEELKKAVKKASNLT